MLSHVDETVQLLLATAAQADREYRVVLLSDHGQSQGATFRHRYSEGLPELVARLTGHTAPITADKIGSEVRSYAAAIVGQHDSDTDDRTVDDSIDAPIVLGSGNLGMISFPDLPGRADTDAIEGRHPGLLDALRTHPGIGFLLVAAPGADGSGRSGGPTVCPMSPTAS